MKTSIIAVALIAAASFTYAAEGTPVSSYQTTQASDHAMTPASTLPAHPSTAPEHKEMKKAAKHPAAAKHIEKKHTEKKASTMDGASSVK